MIKGVMKNRLTELAENGLEWVVITGQPGVELWTGEVVLELQEHYPTLKLAFITPFLEQETNWNDTNQEYYYFIQSQADFVDSITRRKYENPAQLRLKNQFLVKKCDGLLLVYDEEKEGTPKYLLAEGRKRASHSTEFDIVIITPDDLEEYARSQMESDLNYWMS